MYMATKIYTHAMTAATQSPGVRRVSSTPNPFARGPSSGVAVTLSCHDIGRLHIVSAYIWC